MMLDFKMRKTKQK